MQKLELEGFREALSNMVKGFTQSAIARDELTIEGSPDSIDQVGNAANRELAARQLDLQARRLGEAVAALSRIHDGTYGTCQECDAEISIKRLNAVPWARYCLSCQEAADQGGTATGTYKRAGVPQASNTHLQLAE